MDKKPISKKKMIGIIVLVAVIVAGVIVALVLNHNNNKDSDSSASGDATGDSSTSLDYDPMDYVTVGDYEGVDAYYITPEVTDDQIQDEIDSLLSDNVEYKEVKNTAIKSGDKITIDFTGTIDGEEFDGGTDTDYEYVVDTDQMIDGFDDGLLGLKTGDSTTLNLTFPDDYDESVAGKDVVFKVTIKKVKAKQADPTWTDAFCNKISDGKYTTTKAYEASIKEDLMSTATDTSDQTLKSDVWSAVVDNMKVDGYPEALYTQTKESISSSVESTASNYGMEVDDYMQAVYGMSLDDYVKQYVQQNLISEALIKTIGITVSDDEYNTMCEDLMTQTGASSVSDLEDYYGKDTITDYFKSSKLYDYLVDKANVKEVSQTEYDKLTGSTSEE